MTPLHERLTKEAFDAFHLACVEPLKVYRKRMFEIRDGHDRVIAPYKEAVQRAETEYRQDSRAWTAAKEAVAPELSKVFNAIHKEAYEDYEKATWWQRRLRDGMRKIAEDSYEKLLRRHFVEPYHLGELNLGLTALLHGIEGNAQELGARESTVDESQGIIQDLFVESLKPDEEKRNSRIKPLRTELDAVVEKATADLRDAYERACQEHRKSEQVLQNKETELYRKMLQALRAELKEKLKAIFDSCYR